MTPLRRVIVWALLFTVVAGAAFVRARLLDVPLERDEGEYAYVAQLLGDGVPPYGEVYTMKLPGTALVYAGAMALFGETIRGIHLGLLLINAATILLVFLLARRFLEPLPSALAAAVFAVLSLSPIVLGMHAHATHFVVLFALGGLLLILSGVDRGSRALLFGSGLLLGASVLMKQQGLFFVLFAPAYLIWVRLRVRPIAWRGLMVDGIVLLAGAAIPFAAVCLWLLHAGVFDSFRFWTVTYARLYAGKGGEVGWGTIAARGLPLIVGAIALGAVVVEFRRVDRMRAIVFVLGLVLFSIAALVPGFNFRKHYFVLVLPAAALVLAVAVDAVDGRIKSGGAPRDLRLLLPGLVVVGLGALLFFQRGYLFVATPAEAARMTYGVNPFPEAPGIAWQVAARTDPKDRVAILGSEPEILFYAGRRSATGYIYMYEMMEEHPFAEKMQRQMIDEIERAAPAMIVDVRVEPSWSPRPRSPRLVFDLVAGGVPDYDLVDTIRIADTPDNFIRLYQRKKP